MPQKGHPAGSRCAAVRQKDFRYGALRYQAPEKRCQVPGQVRIKLRSTRHLEFGLKANIVVGAEVASKLVKYFCGAHQAGEGYQR